MTEITFRGYTYRGTAEGDHGVFTDSDGRVFAGEIAGDYPCVGVATFTGGTTTFVECDADGQPHGRALDCYAGGDTEYRRWEHGSPKEHAVLYADGTCAYNWKDCRADFAPFVTLKATVVPIKARPPLVPPTAASTPHFLPSHRPPSRSHRPLFWHSQELATTHWHADKVRTGRIRHQPAWALWLVAQQLPNKCTARPTWTTHRAEGCTTHAVVPHA
jgi:hypothetical protein